MAEIVNPGAPTDPSALSTVAIDRAVDGLKELVEEKFHLVTSQFEALERRSKDLDDARATALSAALAAAKELVGSANTNFTRQIDALLSTFDRQIVSLDGKVNDLKDRLTLMEGQRHGGAAAVSDSHANIYSFTSILSAAVAVGALVTTLIAIAFHLTK
jgi:hypothetical protein